MSDTLAERFWRNVGPGIGPVECWEWIGTQDGYGYGHLSVSGRKRKAHRVVLALMGLPDPGPLQVDHLCRNTLCVNPAHLESVTGALNLRRQAARGIAASTDHCQRGHALVPENITERQGRRRCRLCENERQRARRAR